MTEIMDMRCAGYPDNPCGSRSWERVGVISAQKGTYLFQCRRCKRVIIIKGDKIPATDDYAAMI